MEIENNHDKEKQKEIHYVKKLNSHGANLWKWFKGLTPEGSKIFFFFSNLKVKNNKT